MSTLCAASPGGYSPAAGTAGTLCGGEGSGCCLYDDILNTFLYIRDDYDGGGVNRRFDQLDTDDGRLARYLSLYVFVRRSLDVFEYLYSYTPLGVYSL